jgi:hypothetical protein
MVNTSFIKKEEPIKIRGYIFDECVCLLVESLLYMYDKKDKKWNRIALIPKEISMIRNHGFNLVVLGKEIFVLSERGPYLWCININSLEEELICFSSDINDDGFNYMIGNANELTIVSIFGDEITRMCNDRTIQTHTSWKKDVAEKTSRKKYKKAKPYDYCLCNGAIYLNVIIDDSSNICILNEQDYSLIDVIDLGIRGNIQGIICIGRRIWFTNILNKSQKLIEYDLDNRSVVKEFDLPGEYGIRLYLRRFNNTIGIIGSNGTFVAFDLATRKYKCIIKLDAIPLFIDSFCQNGTILLQKQKQMFRINENGAIMQTFPLDMPLSCLDIFIEDICMD